MPARISSDGPRFASNKFTRHLDAIFHPGAKTGNPLPFTWSGRWTNTRSCSQTRDATFSIQRFMTRSATKSFVLAIYNGNVKNDGLFKEATRHLFQTLYHEAFHAYLVNFVYPPEDGEAPRWLNEGLAQIFETAIVEAG